MNLDVDIGVKKSEIRVVLIDDEPVFGRILALAAAKKH